MTVLYRGRAEVEQLQIEIERLKAAIDTLRAAPAADVRRGDPCEVQDGDSNSPTHRQWFPARFVALDLVAGEPIVQRDGCMPSFATWGSVRGIKKSAANVRKPVLCPAIADGRHEPGYLCGQCPSAPAAVQPTSDPDGERYRFACKHNLILAGGIMEFNWPVAPTGKAQWDKYLDRAAARTAQGEGDA